MASLPDPKYAELLRQVTDLQGDLSKTVGACHGLRAESDAVKANYDKLRQEHVELRGRYASVRRQALEEAQAKVAVEQEHEALVKAWRSQLEQKATEQVDDSSRRHPPAAARLNGPPSPPAGSSSCRRA